MHVHIDYYITRPWEEGEKQRGTCLLYVHVSTFPGYSVINSPYNAHDMWSCHGNRICWRKVGPDTSQAKIKAAANGMILVCKTDDLYHCTCARVMNYCLAWPGGAGHGKCRGDRDSVRDR